MVSRSLRLRALRHITGLLGLAGAAIGLAPACATDFLLTSSNVVIDAPAPLFTTSTVTGQLSLSDGILPGQSFGSASITGATFSFGGIPATLADIVAGSAPDPVQAFGTRSADGLSFSVFDFRFSLPATVKGCSFICAGQIVINSPTGPNDPSNFIAIDDLAGDTTSIVSSFTPRFDRVAGAVPEAPAWALMIAGFGLTGAALRQRRTVRPYAGSAAA